MARCLVDERKLVDTQQLGGSTGRDGVAPIELKHHEFEDGPLDLLVRLCRGAKTYSGSSTRRMLTVIHLDRLAR